MTQIIVCDSEVNHPYYSGGRADISHHPEAIVVHCLPRGILIAPLDGAIVGSDDKTFCSYAHAEAMIVAAVRAMGAPEPEPQAAPEKETA